MYSTRFLSLGAPLAAGLWIGDDRAVIVGFSLLAALAVLLTIRHLHVNLRDGSAGTDRRRRASDGQDA